MTLENTNVIKTTQGGLVVGCIHGYGFADGSKTKIIIVEEDCKTATNWTETLQTNSTCYRNFQIIYFLDLKKILTI